MKTINIEDEGVLLFMFGFVTFFLGIIGNMLTDLDASPPFINIIISLCSIMVILGAVTLIMLCILVVLMMIRSIINR